MEKPPDPNIDIINGSKNEPTTTGPDINFKNDQGVGTVGQSEPASPNFQSGADTRENKREPEKPDTKELSNEFITPSSVTTSTHGNKGFKIFVMVGILFIAIIYAVVAYLYFQNKKISDVNNQEKHVSNEPDETDTVDDTPKFSPEHVKILNGNIIYDDSVSQAVIVSKDKYTSTGITGFAKVTVSPDNTKICFESWPPAPEPALFLANVDGSEISEVNPNRRYCAWSPDSQRILYESFSAEASDIFIYDINGKTETNLTPESEGKDSEKIFSLVGLSGDGSKAICSYQDLFDETINGQCEIDLSTKEVTFL